MEIRGFLLFDIDGVIRDVTNSYRLAIQHTVQYFCGWKPSIEDIDKLKSEGLWNNDWDVSIELIKRRKDAFEFPNYIPSRETLRKRFDCFYFGQKFNETNNKWNGFINNESLLVNQEFFKRLTSLNIKWGFVSGAEYISAKFILESKLGLITPPLIAMGDAPEKPDPKGFLTLIKELSKSPLNKIKQPMGYLGDTVADVLTVQNARRLYPNQEFVSFAVAPPHLHTRDKNNFRKDYESKLEKSGADIILGSTNDVIDYVKNW